MHLANLPLIGAYYILNIIFMEENFLMDFQYLLKRKKSYL